MQSFIPGQRWISDTENDLGLGTILKTEHRLVTIVYMASGEIRTYSSETAPLTRVRFAAGDRIRSADERTIIVNDVEEIDGLLAYHGTTDDGASATLSETQLDNFMQFNRPSDKLFNGQFDRERRYHIRLTTREIQQRLGLSSVHGLCGPRVDLIPHQLYIANEVSTRLQPRVLLADEVGLGKTIEAGMIIHSQLVRESISRVLVVVPEPLLHQWLVEMKRRFNLSFSIMDESMYQESLMSASDGNPFLDRQLVLTTLPLLMSDEKITRHAHAADWDTLIVDEAHHLETPEKGKETPGYDCIATLAASIPSLLLLTATPEQLGHKGHFARLQLLDPHRFVSLEKFTEEETNYRSMADIASAIENTESLDASQQAMIDSLDIDQSDTDKTIDTLIDHHGTGRVMFRNTRRAVSGFPQRLFEPYVLNPPDDNNDEDKNGGLVEWIADKISELTPDKLLLICKSVDRVESLNDTLRTRFGIYAAVFHEEMSIVDRDRAAEYFADDESGSPILLCSEIGSEGRNFQFLHHMILIDLPENADLLEQRIGRLDRIGQSHEIKILTPFVKNSRDDFLQRWYHEGLNAFEQTCQVGELVRSDLSERFTRALDGEDEDINALVDEASVLAVKHREKIENGRDRLLELSSHRESISNDLISEIDQFDTENTLQKYMDQALDNLGIDVEDHSAHAFIIKPGEHMAVSEFKGLGEEGSVVTYRRNVALAREDVQFLTWEHPLVQTAMEQIISGGFGQVSVGAMQHETLKRGSVLLEAHYVFDCPAPGSLNVEQFLSGDLLRIVLSSDGRNLTEEFDHETLNEAFHSIKRPLAKQLVDAKRQELQTLLATAETLADTELESLKQRAIEQAETRLTAEHSRLSQLAKRNDSVREDELTGLQTRLQDTHRALTQLRCVLDSVRVFGIA